MMIEHDVDGTFTELAMGGAQPQQALHGQAPTHGLFVQFYTHPVQDSAATLEAGRPIFADSEYVRIMVPGDKSSVIERPARIGHTAVHDNFKYGQEYALFKQGVSDALVGMPLSEWAAVTRAQVKELEFFNIRTVEQLAGMPDTAVQNFAGVSSLRTKAKRYMDEAKGDAIFSQMESKLESRDNTIQTMANQIKEMQQMVTQLQLNSGQPSPTALDAPAREYVLESPLPVMHVPEIPDVMPEYVAKAPEVEAPLDKIDEPVKAKAPAKKKRRAIKS